MKLDSTVNVAGFDSLVPDLHGKEVSVVKLVLEVVGENAGDAELENCYDAVHVEDSGQPEQSFGVQGRVHI